MAEELVPETLALVEGIEPAFVMFTNESATAESLTVQSIGVLTHDRLTVSSGYNTFWNPQVEVAELATIATAQKLAVALNVSDMLDAAGMVAFQQAVIIAEQMVVDSQTTTVYKAMAMLAEALRTSDALLTADTVKVFDELDTNDTIALLLQFMADIGDRIDVAGETSHSLSIIVTENMSAEIGDGYELFARYMAEIAEGVSTWVGFQLGDEAYTGWVMNTEGSKPISEYANYPFNSFCELGGAYYGASDTGLYLLDGNDDEGTDIDASVTTFLTDFNSTAMKRVPTAYVGYTADGKMVLRVRAVSKGQLREHWFSATERTAEAPRELVIPLGRGIRSRYWQFELANANGADFEIDKLELWPVFMNRRV